MQIVINIDDDVYKRALVYKDVQPTSNNANDLSELITAVANGTVLKQGKWIDEADEIDAQFGRHEYKCSECGRIANYYVGGYESWWDIYKPNYCPNCGAKMIVPKESEAEHDH